MAQFLRPISDVTTTNISAGTYASIDESSFSDTDFIVGTNNNTATYECLLGTISDPDTGTCTVRFRYAQADHDTSPFAPATEGNGFNTVTCEVYQGASLVTADSTQTNTAAFVTRTFTFSTSAVTDWTNLRLRFTITGNGGSPSGRRTGAVSWAEIETPDAAPLSRSFTYTAVGTSSLTKLSTLFRTFAYTAVGTATKVRGVFKALAYTGVGTSVLAKARMFFKSFAYTGVGTSVFEKTYTPATDSSLLIDASGEYARRTANLPSPTNFTVCGWWRMDARKTNDYQTIFSLDDASAEWITFQWDSANAFRIHTDGGGTSFTTTPSAGNWYFWAITSDGSTITARLWSEAGTLLDTKTTTGVTLTPTGMYIGNNGWDEYDNGKHKHVRVWDTVLTLDEIVYESRSDWPIRTQNLNTAFNYDGTDLSGNSRNWTVTGTSSVVLPTLPTPLTPIMRGQSTQAAVGSNSYNFTVNVPSDATKLLVFVGSGMGTTNNTATATWNGTGMTKFAYAEATDQVWSMVTAFYLDSPDTGSHTLAVAQSGGNQWGIAVVPLKSAETGAPDYGTAGWVGTDASPRVVTVSGSQDDDLLIAAHFDDYQTLQTTSGSGGIDIGYHTLISNDSDFGAQYKLATGASGSLSFTTTLGDDRAASIIVAVGVPGPTTQVLTYTAVGTSTLAKIASRNASYTYTAVAQAAKSRSISLLKTLTGVATSGLSSIKSYLLSKAFTGVATSAFSRALTTLRSFSFTAVASTAFQQVAGAFKSVWPFLIGNVGVGANVVQLTYTAVATSTHSKILSLLKTLDFTGVGTATLTRALSYLKSLSFVSVGTSTYSRVASYLRSLNYTGVATSLLEKGKTYLRSLAYTSVATNILSFVKSLSRSFAYVSVGTNSFNKLASYLRSLSFQGTAQNVLTTTKSLLRNLAYTSVGTSALSATKDLLKSFAFTGVATSALATLKVKLMALAATAVGTLTSTKVSSYLRSFSPTAVATNALSRLGTFYRSFSTTGVATSTLARVASYLRSLSFTGVATSFFEKVYNPGSQLFFQAANMTAVAVSGVARRVGKLYTYTGVGTATRSIAITYQMAIANIGVATATVQKAVSKLLSYVGVGTVQLAKRVSKSIAYTAVAVVDTLTSYATSAARTFTAVGTSILTKLTIPFGGGAAAGTIRRAFFKFLGRR